MKGEILMPYNPTVYNDGAAPALNATNLNHAENAIAQLYGNLADNAFVASTLLSASWVQSDGKWTYDLTATYPAAQYNLTISVAPTATEEQYNAFAAAKICGSATTNILTAMSPNQPTVDIPVIIKKEEK